MWPMCLENKGCSTRLSITTSKARKTKAVARYYEDLVRYGGKMNRRDCEEFMREFRAEMEEKAPSKQQLVVGKEKAKRRQELRELERQLGIKKGRKR